MSLLSDFFRWITGGDKPTPTPTPTPIPTPIPTPTPTPVPDDIPAQLLLAHNQERSAKRLAPLVANSLLQSAAQSHADYMAKRRRMAHFGIGDGDPWSRTKATGYKMSSGGENVAWNQLNIQEVMQAWMNSSGHRANILGSYREFGGAVAFGPNQDPYWCSVFATPASAGEPQRLMMIDDSIPRIIYQDGVTWSGHLIDPVSM